MTLEVIRQDWLVLNSNHVVRKLPKGNFYKKSAKKQTFNEFEIPLTSEMGNLRDHGNFYGHDAFGHHHGTDGLLRHHQLVRYRHSCLNDCRLGLTCIGDGRSGCPKFERKI